jgi:hypothetical protein
LTLDIPQGTPDGLIGYGAAQENNINLTGRNSPAHFVWFVNLLKIKAKYW